MTQLSQVLATAKNSSLPRYQALYEALRQQILDGLLLPGMCLPSSRMMSDALGFSRNTVITAIEQLCVEGYAQARAKSGVYILSTVPVRWENQRTIVTKHQPTISARGHAILKESRIPPTR
jgi:GntR family transcriptional regulator/MocR family aminotransferase